MATVGSSKGPEPMAVARLATFMKESGYAKLVYKSDQEPSIRSLFEAAFQAASLVRGPSLNQAMPNSLNLYQRPHQSESPRAMGKLKMQ